jgi:hypothetical protein
MTTESPTADKPDQKRRRRKPTLRWIVVALLLAYPPSFFPACIAGDWITYWGVVTPRTCENTIDAIYAPITFATACSRTAFNAVRWGLDALKPLEPPSKK